jgi:hypothetical protein
MEKRYVLARDGDCHWFIIPEDKISSFDNDIDEIYGTYPDYAISIDSYERVRFTGFTIV